MEGYGERGSVRGRCGDSSEVMAHDIDSWSEQQVSVIARWLILIHHCLSLYFLTEILTNRVLGSFAQKQTESWTLLRE